MERLQWYLDALKPGGEDPYLVDGKMISTAKVIRDCGSGKTDEMKTMIMNGPPWDTPLYEKPTQNWQCLPDEVVQDGEFRLKKSPNNFRIYGKNCNDYCEVSHSAAFVKERPCYYNNCIKIDPRVDCPGPFGNVVGKGYAVSQGKFDGQKIKCQYDIDQLTSTCEAATAWTKYKQSLDVNYYPDETFMLKLCAKSVPGVDGIGVETDKSLCPKDINGNTPYKQCSRINSCPMCRDWALKNKDKSDTVMRDYCAANSTKDTWGNPQFSDPACMCINASQDPNFETLNKRVGTGGYGCWYPPCQNFELDKYLVPSIHRITTEQRSTCPNVCKIDWNIVDSDVDINNINQHIDCNAPPQPPPKPDSDTSKWLEKHKLAVTVAAGSISIAVVAVGVILIL
jgi:hypothetical protein